MSIFRKLIFRKILKFSFFHHIFCKSSEVYEGFFLKFVIQVAEDSSSNTWQALYIYIYSGFYFMADFLENATIENSQLWRFITKKLNRTKTKYSIHYLNKPLDYLPTEKWGNPLVNFRDIRFCKKLTKSKITADKSGLHLGFQNFFSVKIMFAAKDTYTPNFKSLCPVITILAILWDPLPH